MIGRITDEEREQRGDRARQLLSSDIFYEAMGALRDTLLAELERLPSSDVNTLQALHMQLRAVRQMRGRLEAWEQESKTIKHQREGKNARY